MNVTKSLLRKPTQASALLIGLITLATPSVSCADPSAPSPPQVDWQGIIRKAASDSSAAKQKLPRAYPPAVRHIKFPTGIRFADVSPAGDPYEPLGKLGEAKAKETYDKVLDSAVKNAEQSRKTQNFAQCLSSNVEKQDFEIPGISDKEVGIEDLLFLADSPPLDYESRYGDAVEVQVLKQGGDPMISGFASALRVDCVPYRLRITNKKIYRYKGDAALQHFGDDILSLAK